MDQKPQNEVIMICEQVDKSTSGHECVACRLPINVTAHGQKQIADASEGIILLCHPCGFKLAEMRRENNLADRYLINPEARKVLGV